MTKNEALEEIPTTYRLASVEEAAAPAGCSEGSQDGRWHRYVIERSGSTIVGQRRGTRQQVTSYANAYVDELNARSSGQSASPWAPRQKK